MRTIITIVLGILIAQTGLAQNDTLLIKLNDYGHMQIIDNKMKKIKKINFNLDENYSGFYNIFKEIDKSELSEGCFLIKSKQASQYSESKKISIEEIKKAATEHFFHNGIKQSVYARKYTLELIPEKRVIIKVDSLSDFDKLTSISLDSLYRQAVLDYKNQDTLIKVPHRLIYSSYGNQLDKKASLYLPLRTSDYLMLYGTYGVSVLNSNFMPEISANMDLQLNHLFGVKQRFGTSVTWMFLPDENDFYNINTYVFNNIHYYFKTDNEWQHKVSIGYMTDGNGNHFSDNTWNAYWLTKINKLSIKFGGFLTKNTFGDYKVLPSVGLGFGF